MGGARTMRYKNPWETLCWHCFNAVPSSETGAGCSWSGREHRPVEGWEAERCDVFTGHTSGGHTKRIRMESYRVDACPEFVEG